MPLTLTVTPAFRLKEIETADQNDLRTWKNQYKTSFFFQQEITPEMQDNWFMKYQTRNNDHMFMVQELDADGNWTNIGCMGYRDEGETVDIYNLMRGKRLENGSGKNMGDALNAMLSHAQNTYAKPVTCMVLQHNAARGWYESNGFDIVAEHPDHKGDTTLAYIDYRLNPDRFNPVTYIEEQ